ncbi:MAG TPA: protealysin inhibitor emfourin [Nocardioidaceae bacterium]|nr:protealysin inhibitor emfourin [Nocardioidaceae bacterium]
MARCSFVPPYLISRLSQLPDDDPIGRAGRTTRAIDDAIRERRRRTASGADGIPAPPVEARWTVYSAGHTTKQPGSEVRADGDDASGDDAVDELYDGLAATWDLLADVFSYPAVDGQGTPVTATAHHGDGYANAFWDGRQLVFGDGDGVVFGRFTRPIDVLAHEYAHGITQYTAALAYEGQPGSLNESISDVFGAMVKQRVLGQTVDEADWLVGEGVFLPGVQGRALRSMKEPGTAYDDPRLGKDPQVASMRRYVDTTDDGGGVHINSGIPNRAFCLAATSLGGRSWEGAGAIWWAALVGGHVGRKTDFVGFADATLEAAGRLYGDDSAECGAVRSAWAEVGVLAPDPDRPSDAGGVVYVRRSGGFAGLITEREINLASDPAGAEAAALLRRVNFDRLSKTPPQPDRFVYLVRTAGREVRLNEQDVPPELGQLIDLILGRD